MYLMICKKTVKSKLYRSAKIVESYRKPNNKYGHKIDIGTKLPEHHPHKE